MKLILAAVVSLLMTQVSVASSSPTYDMKGTYTDLVDWDVDYMSPPIDLVRNTATFQVHHVSFNVNYYKKYCVAWQQQCVAYDQNGKCVQWQTYCAQWDYQAQKWEKRIDLNFNKAPVLGASEAETYELTITKFKPFDEGEDTVYTDLKSKSGAPVTIRKLNDFSYTIEAK